MTPVAPRQHDWRSVGRRGDRARRDARDRSGDPVHQRCYARSLIDQTLWAPRTIALLVAAFGGLALLLAAIGLYGVLAYTVSQRTQEIGLRMALGAGPRDIVGMIVGRGLIWTAAGAAAGLAVAVIAASGLDRSYAASDLRIRLRSSRFRCCSAPSPRSRRTCRRAEPRGSTRA